MIVVGAERAADVHEVWVKPGQARQPALRHIVEEVPGLEQAAVVEEGEVVVGAEPVAPHPSRAITSRSQSVAVRPSLSGL